MSKWRKLWRKKVEGIKNPTEDKIIEKDIRRLKDESNHKKKVINKEKKKTKKIEIRKKFNWKEK